MLLIWSKNNPVNHKFRYQKHTQNETINLEDKAMHSVSFTKQELAALVSVGKELLQAMTQPVKQLSAGLCPQQEQGQVEL